MLPFPGSLTWTSDNVSHVLFNGGCVVAEDKGMTACVLLTIGEIEV